MTTIFLLRIDSMTGRGEGEYYDCNEKGIFNPYFSFSPKITDQQVIIATGKKAMKEVYDRYIQTHQLTNMTGENKEKDE